MTEKEKGSNSKFTLYYYSQLSDLLNSIPYALLLVDKAGEIVLFNTNTQNLFGYEKAELLAMKIEQLIPDRFRHKHKTYREEYILHPKMRPMGIGMDLFGLKKNGMEFPIEISLSPLQTEIGICTIVALIDISVRKNSERKEAMLTTAMNFSDEAVIATDLEGKIIIWNRGAEHLYGYAQNDVLNQSLQLLVPNTKLDEFNNLLKKIEQGEHIVQFETLRIRKNGEIVPVSITSSPILSEKGRPLGAIGVDRDISQQKQVESKLKYIGEHDSLTGLITRPLMNDRIQQGILWSDRHKNMMAICFLDIDDFKQVNDTYGHIIGDQLLIEISKRLKRCLRKTDSIARVGGDEFIFILLEINSEDAAINVIKKIFQCFKIPFQLDDLSITVTYSIGVSLYPKDGKKSLIEKSDSAMYYVKKNGKNNFKIFDKLHC